MLGCGGAPLPAGPLEGAEPARRLAEGLGFTEGPLWDGRGERLLFTSLDEPLRSSGGRILAWSEPGKLETLRQPSGNANGLAFAPDGALLCAEHGSRGVTRRSAEGAFVPLADPPSGAPFNAPNDLAVRSDGTLYFTDPDFVGPEPPVLGFSAVWRLAPGSREAVTEAVLDGPNGLALAPDEHTLYVADMRRGRVLAFDVAPSGALSTERPFAASLPLADGLAVDGAGNVFVATAREDRGAVVAFAPDGWCWGSIPFPEPVRNCAFGGPDRRTLFVTAGGSLWSVRLPRALPANPLPGSR